MSTTVIMNLKLNWKQQEAEAWGKGWEENDGYVTVAFVTVGE